MAPKLESRTIAGMRREIGIGLLLFVASSVLIWNCWNAEFLGYDDVAHIHLIPQIFGRGSLLELFKPPVEFEYLPVTILSYRADYLLLGQWMEHSSVVPDWSFAIRLMNCVYHAAAAYMLLRFLPEIGVSRGAALFVALVFAVHPTACESVCWASERKNILAGTFGFATLWVYVAFESKRWRVPLAAWLYLLATLSKPSALGILPVLILIDLFGGRAGLRGEGETAWKPGAKWLGIAGRAVPFVAISVFVLYMNMAGTAATRVPPPGGSIFSAALTDVEILGRYVRSLILPLGLSFAYFVEPITSVLSPRLWAYGAALAGFAALTIWLAANRRRAVFGWIWAVGALGPCLNFVAISHPMQDRYIYLSLPGVFLAVVEACAGVAQRVRIQNGALRIAAVTFVAGLAVVSLVRGGDYVDTLTLFFNAIQKQPLASNAHYGLMFGFIHSYERMGHLTGATSEELQQRALAFRQKADEERRVFLTCPDVKRHFDYARMSVEEAQAQIKSGNAAEAETLYLVAAHPETGIIVTPKVRASALRGMAMLKLQQQHPADALSFANAAVEVDADRDYSRYIRARVEMALAKQKAGDAAAAQELMSAARTDLEQVPATSEVFASAQELLKQTGPAH